MKLTLAAAHSVVSVVYLLYYLSFVLIFHEASDFPVMKTRRKRTET